MDSLQLRSNIMEMAKKKRHIYLLDKLQREGTLSRAELNELAKFEPGSPPGYVATQEDLANLFKVEPRTIRRWIKAGMPQEENGYSILAVKQWRDLRNSSHVKEETFEFTKSEFRNQIIFGMRIGIMFFKDNLLLNTHIISKECLGKSSKNIGVIIKQYSEELLDLLLNSDELNLIDLEL
jgi:hypothetical protein